MRVHIDSFDGVNVAKLRAATPGTAAVVHLNNAGAGLPSSGVLARLHAQVEVETRGAYEAAAAAAGELEQVRPAAAAMLGVHETEVAVTTSATESIQLALAAIRWRPGDRVVATSEEYVAQAMAFRALTRRGVELTVVRHRPDGLVDLAAMEAALDPPPRLVSICHVPMWTGVVQPVTEVAARAHAVGALVLVDAAQSLGQVPVDAAALGADLLVATGRKFLRGPRGTGLLVVRGAAAGLRPAAVSMRSHEWVTPGGMLRPLSGAGAFERYEHNVAALLGLGVACRELDALGARRVAERIAAVAAQLRAAVVTVPGVRLADPPAASAGIVALHVRGYEPEEAARALRSRCVQTWQVPVASVPWSAGPPVLRLSPHVFTDGHDVERCVDALTWLQSRPRFAAREPTG